MTSRVIVKNLPKHATEQRLREHFAEFGEVTDCSVKCTKDGRSRQFAFVGFRNEADAREVVKQLNRSFFDTARISVEAAHAPGSESIARPWSRYAAGSSAHSRRHTRIHTGGSGEQDASHIRGSTSGAAGGSDAVCKPANARPPAPVRAPPGARAIKTTVLQPTKAGMSGRRVHVEFGSSDEEQKPGPSKMSRETVKKEARAGGLAFDESIADLDYLRAKTAASASNSSTLHNTGTVTSMETQNGSDVEAQHNERRRRGKRRKARGAKDAAEEAELDDSGIGGRRNKIDAKDLTREEVGAQGDGEVGSTLGDPIPADIRHGAEDADVDLDSTGRLYVTNVPYGATEEELRAHFEPFGEVASVYICKNEDTLKSRGFAYVAYVFPECAVRANSELDMMSFQGRLLRVSAARDRPPPIDASATAPIGKSSYKRRQAEKQKKVDAHLEHTWNLLYVSANAAADVAASQLGVAKSELFGKDVDNVAVTSALTETSVIQQTKRWLQNEGIRISAFEQSGKTLATSLAASGPNASKRRDDAFIVKHLPAACSVAELRERFARYGELIRCALAPSGTVAIVQYAEKTHAQRAFQKLAFSRYMHVPLYLEWAPEDAFDDSPRTQEGKGVEGAENNGPASGKSHEEGKGEDVDEQEENAALGSLFVKNLSFSTTEDTLKSQFSKCKGFRSAVVMRKKAAVAKDGQANGEAKKSLSMGYGFLEFDTAANALAALKTRQGTIVDGHSLQLQVSQRGARQHGRHEATVSKKTLHTLPSPRLCVRNLAFEAKNRELRQLFGAYGSVTAVRIPKKTNYGSHRGFAFIDFASKSEAAAAYEALQHTHLYGRRLVIEPAEEKSNDVAAVQEAAQKRQASHALSSEAKKRRRAGVLEMGGAGGGGDSFQEAFAA